MIITRKKKIPLHWAFYAQLPLILSIYGNMVVNAPFLLMIKKFIDNPAAIMGLISIEVYLTLLGGPFVSWLSDRIWTKFGRRKFFQGSSDAMRAFILILMPFAPNLILLIILRWLYGMVGDLGAPTQALAYEIVPAKQRGKSSGFMKAFMQVGNIVFFTLVLGRFDDVYFMGPFSHFMSLSGGTIMFVMAALLLVGTAMFEFLGIKEIYPPGRKRLNEGRKPGQNVVSHFFFSFVRDVLGKDLLPLYLLLIASVMFAFSLGMFGPLLFTEQWGYSLQEMGNTIAVGAILGIAIGLLAGWLADKTSKMLVFTWCTIGNLVINIAYTAYVYYKPDFRPDLWEIIFFGNLAHIFGATKGVVAFPLFMEYVARNRMGAAGAGITLFNGLFRNAVSLFVGFWLLAWSWLFLPQAGYHLEAFFSEEKGIEEVRQSLESAGIDLADYDLQPLHQVGVDGDVSTRWWLHHNVDEVHEGLEERKKLENEIAALNAKKISVLTSEERAAEIQEEIVQKRIRIEAIDEQLSMGADQLRERLVPAIDELRFGRGEQILAAQFEDNRVLLELRTVEPLNEGDPELLRTNLLGPEHALMRDETAEDNANANANGNGELQGDISVKPLEGEVTGVQVAMTLDERFMRLFNTSVAAGLTADQANELSSILTAAFRSTYGRQAGTFDMRNVQVTPLDTFVEKSQQQKDSESTEQQEEEPQRQFRLEFQLVNNSQIALEAPEVAEMLEAEELFAETEAVKEGNTLQITTTLNPGDRQVNALEPDSEEAERLAALIEDGEQQMAFLRLAYPKIVETLAAQPIFITVPRHTIESKYGARVYEYFFSSQTIQIMTDIFGLAILFMIMKLEARGTLHRYGAEEDEKR